MSEEKGLGTRAIRGMAWAYGAFVGGRILGLVATAILARLLTPKDFGLVALALIFTTLLDAIRDLGLGQALIVASPEEEHERAQTVFGWSVVLGVTITALMAALSAPAAAFFHEPQLKGMLPVLGASFTLRALGTTHYSLARKHLHYRVRTVSELTEVTVRGVAGIALALTGFGAWSLILAFVAGVAASTTMLWIMVDFRPRFTLMRTHLGDLLRFGGVLTLVDLAAVIYYNLDYIFVGRILGAAQLGLYTIGFRIPELVVLNLAYVAGDVLFPAYSELEPSRLREGYQISVRYTAMLTMPITAGLIVLSEPLILVAFGERWRASIGVTQVIAVSTLLATMSIPPGTVLKVTRQAYLMVLFSVPMLFALAALLTIFTNRGIETVAWATTAVQAAMLPVQTTVVARQLNVSVAQLGRLLLIPLLGSLAIAAALFPIERAIVQPVLALVVGIAAGTLVYMAVLLLFARDDLRRLWWTAFPSSAPTPVPAGVARIFENEAEARANGF
ncbi:MAG TPA: lipopolysaccharide biosynthesis protein [Conexibacter sp.]|jgi:PST family polysaccharide transporter